MMLRPGAEKMILAVLSDKHKLVFYQGGAFKWQIQL